MYIGNDTGMVHVASTFKKPCIVLYSQCHDKDNDAPGYLSSVDRFHPYDSEYIDLRGQRSIDECSDIHIHGGCCRNEPHCISLIEPKEIVDAFQKFYKKSK